MVFVKQARRTGLVLGAVAALAACSDPPGPGPTREVAEVRATFTNFDAQIDRHGIELAQRGREVFRFDTFGDEAFWSGKMQLHNAILGQKLGGVGGGLSPAAALKLGLKVDSDALPANVMGLLQSGKLDVNDPANTVALLQANAVVGVRGFFQGTRLASVGITCAFCHSTVNDSVAPGIGRRLDGWPNRDLDVGKIIMLAPNRQVLASLLTVDLKTLDTVLASWGAGKFDAELILDGKAFRPDGKSAATLIPAAFGLAGQNLHTYTGWGSIPYWNAFVANLEMNGQGTFFDPRLNDPVKFPLAVKNRLFDVRHEQDLITSKLPMLQAYQNAIPAPEPPAGSYDKMAAARGEATFAGKAGCASCHTEPLWSEPGWAMHTGNEIGIDEFQAQRSPDGRYRTTPLGGLWARQKGGFYHDGRFPTLLAVVEHYDQVFRLGLTSVERGDLVEYLKSLGNGNDTQR
jgi:hypothetical protein